MDKGQLTEMLMEAARGMGMGMAGKGQEETLEKVRDAAKEAAAKHGVTILYAVNNMGDYTNQWFNLPKKDDEGQELYWLSRGIKKLAADLLDKASTEPSEDTAEFHTALFAAMAPFGAQPLYVVARYGSFIRSHITPPKKSASTERSRSLPSSS